jgi:hypothetical protein
LQLMASLISERNRFSTSAAPARLDYQPRRRRRTSVRVARRGRPERHNPHSIATLRMAIARQLLRHWLTVFSAEPRGTS